MIRFNKNLICKSLQDAQANIFTFAELSELLRHHIEQWTVSEGEDIQEQAILATKTHGVNALIQSMAKAGILEKAILPFPYRKDTRYLFGEVDSLDLVQSLSQDGYFTHFTALFLNDLTEQTPKTIFFNIEQQTSGGMGQLTQDALNRAFKAEPRLSSNVIEYKSTRIVKVNGRNTNQLGVFSKQRNNTAAVRATDIDAP